MKRGSLMAIAVAGLLAAGCRAFEDTPLALEHPANPQAPEAPIPPRSKTLDVATSDPIRPPERAGTKATPTPGAKHEGGHGHSAPSADTPAAPTTAATPTAPAKVMYICPMDEDVRSDGPGNCPKCGMKLVPEAAHKDHK